MKTVLETELFFNEDFRDIPGYEGRYAASNYGRIWSHISNRFLKDRPDKDGYRKITIMAPNGKQKTYQVHRLVALSWIPNPEDLPQVNHKDENKENNHYTNLEWCDAHYNINYGTRNNKISAALGKPVRCVETGEVYESTSAAARALNIGHVGIAAAARGAQKTSYKLHWEYVGDDN